jgi:hypothetical protein
MRKFFAFILAAFAVFFIPLALLAQDVGTGPGDTAITLPDLPLTFGFGQYVISFVLYAAVVVGLTSFINKLTGLKGFAKQYLSWFVAVIVGVAGYLLNFWVFKNMHPYQVLIYAIMTGYGANGLYDWILVQRILRALHLEKAVDTSPSNASEDN